MTGEGTYWRHWWEVHLHWWWSDARLLLRRALTEFRDDHCPQMAASISYYVLFSIFPLAIFLVAISGLVLQNDSLRADVVDQLFDWLPLSEDEGREDLESAIGNVATGLSALGLLSVIGLLWAASGMMGSMRRALDEAWNTSYQRPFVHGKLMDFGMILAVGLLVALSIGTTIFLQVARRVNAGLSESLGPLGAGATVSLEVVAVLVPLGLSFATFLLIYKLVPAVLTRFRHVWPGALVAAILFEIVKNSFAIYLRNFGNYDAIYGSLGAVIAFLFFVYLSANSLLFGAEMAAEWPRVIHGHYDESLPGRAAAGNAQSLPSRLRAQLRALVVHQEQMPDHVDAKAGERRRQRKAAEISRRVDGAPADDKRAGSAADPRDAPGERRS